MDSKLVVEQMSGRWKVKNPGMAELNQQAPWRRRSTPSPVDSAGSATLTPIAH